MRTPIRPKPLAVFASLLLGLVGIFLPLSALAACVSDREEDALKLEVVAEVRGARQCASAAGRYDFVETKNLNAFLMRIGRAPTRRKTDRCIELRLALECLRARRSGGSRSG